MKKKNVQRALALALAATMLAGTVAGCGKAQTVIPHRGASHPMENMLRS